MFHLITRLLPFLMAADPAEEAEVRPVRELGGNNILFWAGLGRSTDCVKWRHR
jgi:hypothetical protein